MSRPILSRPRTFIYGSNYDKGESYYKPMVDHLDRKYSGRPLFPEPRNSLADEIAARRSDIGNLFSRFPKWFWRSVVKKLPRPSSRDCRRGPLNRFVVQMKNTWEKLSSFPLPLSLTPFVRPLFQISTTRMIRLEMRQLLLIVHSIRHRDPRSTRRGITMRKLEIRMWTEISLSRICPDIYLCWTKQVRRAEE